MRLVGLLLLLLLALLAPSTSIDRNAIGNSKRDKPEWATDWRKKKLYLVGSTWNTQDQVISNLQMNIDIIGGLWENMQVIIYGDSKSLERWMPLIKARRETNYVFIQQPHSDMPPERIERLVIIRNALLAKTRELISMNQEPYRSIVWCQMDMDSMMKFTFHPNVIENAMNRWKDWDVVSFNRPYYYDIWALRYEKYDVNVWDGRPFNESIAIIDEIADDIGKQLKATDLFPVYSAFNGLAFYKFRFTRGCNFWKNGTYDMEHQEFHKCLRNQGARIRIWSEFIVDEFYKGHP